MHVRHVVTNEVLVLALDYLYRKAMKKHEREELLDHARRVADRLGIEVAETSVEGDSTDDPLLAKLRLAAARYGVDTAATIAKVEGYYADNAELATYFRLVRALQAQSRSMRSAVADMPAFQRLEQVTASPLYGTPPDRSDSLLPRSIDVLGRALAKTAPLWDRSSG